MILPTEQFDGENGCISPQLYPTVQQRLHGPALHGWRAFAVRLFRWFARRIECRENVVVAGPVRPGRR